MRRILRPSRRQRRLLDTASKTSALPRALQVLCSVGKSRPENCPFLLRSKPRFCGTRGDRSRRVAEHVSRPRGEFRENLQPLMSFAVGCRHDRSSDLRHRHQPSGKIIGNGNNAPLAGFRLPGCDLNEALAADQMNVLPFQHRQLSGAESGEKADGNGCQQRTTFLIHRTCCEELARGWFLTCVVNK